MLQVPGERLRRVLPARAAAWWYNGHPDAFTAAGGHESGHDVIADALRGGGGGGCRGGGGAGHDRVGVAGAFLTRNIRLHSAVEAWRGPSRRIQNNLEAGGGA